MKITLDALQVIEAIARWGTFGLAAEALHKAPSSLSYVVQKLESDLGVTVFDRSGHRVRLTKAGEVLVEESRQLLRAAQDLEERVRRVDAGWETELKIATEALLPFDALTPLVSAFQAENTYTRLLFTQAMLREAWTALVSNQVDLIIGAVGDPPVAQGLFSVPVGSLRTLFVVSPGHPLASAPEPIDCAVLWQHQFVEIGSGRDTIFGMSPALVEGQKQINVPSLQSKEAVLLAGIACGYLPSCVAQAHIAGGRLVQKQLCEARPAQTLHIAWRSKNPGPALRWWLERQQTLIDTLRERLDLEAEAA